MARSEGSGNSPKLNLSYKFDPDHLLYVTWSKGFRPGGVNRNGGGTLPPYQPDYPDQLRTGLEDDLGQSSPAIQRRVVCRGMERTFNSPIWGRTRSRSSTTRIRLKSKVSRPIWNLPRLQGLTLSGGFSLLDAKLTQAFCKGETPSVCGTPGYEDYAPSGTQLPTTPKFKGDVTARYSFAIPAGYVGKPAGLCRVRRAALG
jgi:iron complex outermembrane receptor protein